MKPYETWWEIDGQEALATPRARRCMSCGIKLPVGEQVVGVRRWKVYDDADDYDDGPSLAKHYICLPCHADYERRVASHEDAPYLNARRTPNGQWCI